MRNVLLPIGTTLHSPKQEYRVEAVLGQGGFGITYKVSAEAETTIRVGNIEQTQTIRLYFAIKEFFLKGCDRDSNGQTMVYAPTLETDVRTCLQDFITEARRINMISTKSEHIVKVNEVFEANNTAYYVMEYLSGGNVSDYVMKHGAMTWSQTKSIITPIARAIQLLHGEKLLHMDIKPDNIMLKQNKEGKLLPVLIDFGISKHFNSKGSPTSHLMAKGASDGYAPQEQYAGIENFAPEIDVYALGATMLFLLTGKQPPKAFDVPLINKTIEQLSSSQPTYVQDIVAKAMAPNKYERTHDIAAFLLSLNGKDTNEKISRPNETTKIRQSAQKTKSKKNLPLRILAGAGLFVLILAIVLWPKPKDTSPKGNEESLKLTEAISNNDSISLRKYAEFDSVHAFYPYATLLLANGDTINALKYAQKAKGTKDSSLASSLVEDIVQQKNDSSTRVPKDTKNAEANTKAKVLSNKKRKAESKVRINNVAKHDGSNHEESNKESPKILKRTLPLKTNQKEKEDRYKEGEDRYKE